MVTIPADIANVENVDPMSQPVTNSLLSQQTAEQHIVSPFIQSSAPTQERGVGLKVHCYKRR